MFGKKILHFWFFIKNFLTTLKNLIFHIKLRICMQLYLKNHIEILTVIYMNLKVNLWKLDSSTVLNLPTQKHEIF